MADGFSTAIARSGAMFEDYRPLTGTGRDDSAYSWTAAVHLILADSRQPGA